MRPCKSNLNSKKDVLNKKKKKKLILNAGGANNMQTLYTRDTPHDNNNNNIIGTTIQTAPHCVLLFRVFWRPSARQLPVAGRFPL